MTSWNPVRTSIRIGQSLGLAVVLGLGLGTCVWIWFPQSDTNALVTPSTQHTALARLLSHGATALVRGQLEEAEQAYASAQKLAPEDNDVQAGLKAVRAARAARVNQAQASQASQASQEIRNKEQRARQREHEERVAARRREYLARFEAGQAALVAGRYTEAIREFTAAEQLVPGDQDALLGVQQAEKGLQAAQDRLQRRTAAEVLLERARGALAVRRFKEGVETLEQVVRLVPDDPEMQKQLQAAQETFRKAREAYEELLRQGQAALEAGRWQEAARRYADAARGWPEDDRAAQGQRESERRLAEVRTVRAAYDRAITQGHEGLSAGKWNEAQAGFQEALRLQPGDLEALEGLRAVRERGQEEKRVLALEQLLREGSAAMSRRDYAEAERAYAAALRLRPDEGQMGPIQLALSRARYEQALVDGRRALAQHQRELALRAYEEALLEMPRDPVASWGIRQARLLPPLILTPLPSRRRGPRP